ncbi:MAG: type IX secretion system membrane protein PorP/SprF [Prevotellaceae bacterium]|nr:type IX secretion system membrane protein PorP/SprF [Prevotella sp.]MDD6817113.1 type IX secretion system membrane protein PorP/SprF [Prevotellaceae bacterium]MDD6977569.1 type IX secretion system membrane protein PorP/SprF [Prevotellaceae bacterium]MDY5006497.1 type IX secretion system membrane protein PorP/SprF [Prevotella sp.]MDY6198985.1 type IX secretion system membrane protein PorP/SprF [Prevotella sp.]
MIIAMLVMMATKAKAQYDPTFSHYWALEPSFNPAAVGKESKLNIAVDYAMALTGFENNPTTMYAAADMPFYFIKSYHGAGAQMLNDQIGLFSHKTFALQYAFRQKLFGGMLGIGVQVGMISETFDGSKVDTETPNDNAFPSSEVNGSALDIGAGLYYTHRQWYVGISAKHLTAPTIQLGERQDFKIDMSYFLTAGYNIKLRNPFISIQPSLLARYDGTAYRVDMTGRVKYTHEKKVMYAGAAYSPTNSVTFMVGGMFHGVMLGYSYELYTSAIEAGNGGHELFVGYQMDMNLQKKGRNKHKSVRLL